MNAPTLTNVAPALTGSGPAREELTPAERYDRDRAELKSLDPEVRKAAVARIVESGSSAVYPLLCAVECDVALEVREAAVWALLRLTDDMLCEGEEEREWVGEVLQRNGAMHRYLRLGLEAVQARSTGGSPAKIAAGWLIYVDRPSRVAGMRFLGDMVRLAPDLDPELPEVLCRISRRGLLGFRHRARELLGELARWQEQGTHANALHSLALARRREAAQVPGARGDLAPHELLAMAATDPDRTVRHVAGAALYRLMQNGTRVRAEQRVVFKDDEVAYVFRPLAAELIASGNLTSGLKVLMGEGVRERRLLMRFLVHLRPVASDECSAGLDELIREGMRDKDRNVRREATVAAKAASSDLTQAELAGRLRSQLRRNPPVLLNLVFVIQVGAIITGFALGKGAVGMVVFHALNILTLLLRNRKEAGSKHLIGDEEYLETLIALEPTALSSPEKLRASLPELRTLASKMGQVSPEVRAKARELLAKVHEATLHELPIAAGPPQSDPATLPVVASADRRG